MYVRIKYVYVPVTCSVSIQDMAFEYYIADNEKAEGFNSLE